MLPRAARLKRNRDFRAVYGRGKVFSTPHLAFHVRFRSLREPNSGSAPARIGFVISKKTAKRAHDRNRIKRRLREICRQMLLPNLQTETPFDAFFVVRPAALEADFARLAADVERLGRQAGLL